MGSHTPPLQPTEDAFEGTVHMLLHAPQLLLSVCSSTQPDGHIVIGDVQLDMQPPLTHVCPAPQTVPHIPQLFGSVLRFAQLGGVVSLHTE